MMEQMDGVVLTLADLVMVSDAMEPYALTFQPDGDLDGTIETYALVVMKRAGGVLLAVPADAIPQEVLELGDSDSIYQHHCQNLLCHSHSTIVQYHSRH